MQRVVSLLLVALTLGACSTTVTDTLTSQPRIGSFSVTPQSVVAGTPTSVTFHWSYSQLPIPDATCSIDQGVGAVTDGQASSLTLSQTTTFTLTCTNSSGSDSATTTVSVVPAAVAPSLAAFSASPASVVSGTPTDVTWTFSFANSPSPAPTCSIDQGIGAVASGDVSPLTLTSQTVFTLTCTNDAGSDTATFSIGVTPAPIAPVIDTFTSNPTSVQATSATLVTWSWTYANSPSPAPSCSIDQGVGTLGNGDSTSVTQSADTTYTLTCTNAGGTATAQLTITATPVPIAPSLASFDANPSSVTDGVATSVSWSWTYSNAPTPVPSCSIDQSVGTLASGDARTITQSGADVTYTLTCTNSAGSDTRTVTVTTTAAPVAPVLASFTATPSSIPAGTASNLTFDWTYSNAPTPAPSCSIDQNIGTLTSGSTSSVTQSGSTTYTLTCSNSAGSDSLTATVDVTGSISCSAVINPDMSSCPSYLGDNVVSLCTCGGTNDSGGTHYPDQATLSCNPGSHTERIYCWTAPADGTYEFKLTGSPTNPNLALALFDKTASSCGELACAAPTSGPVLDRTMTMGDQVFVVIEEGASGSQSFTLGINQLP